MPRINRRNEPEEPLKYKVTKRYLKGVKGMRDILFQDQKYWDYIDAQIEEFVRSYSFKRMWTPVLEHPQLFLKGLAKKTTKPEDLLNVTTEEGETYCLRAELTLPLIRAYLEHNIINQPQPIKVYTTGATYRSGDSSFKESRQLYQFASYIFGETSPIADVQVIQIAYNILKNLGLNIQVSINSIGDKESQSRYKEELLNYYRGKKKLLCEKCQKHVGKAPLYILNCHEECCCELKVDAPQAVDWLSEECKEHFIKVLECLDEVEIPYVLNPYLVSGLDQSAKIIFELVEVPENEEEKTVVLGAGGRYDELVEKVGGPSVPLVGYSFLYETIVKRIRNAKIEVEESVVPDVFVAQLGEMAKKKSLSLFENLRKEGISAAESFSKDNLKTQFENATKMGVKFTLVLGQKEILDGTIIIRDMDGGGQEIVDFNKVVPDLKKRLAKMK